VIQAQEVTLSSERGGRVASIPVERGQTVSRDQIVVQLDTTLLDAQIAAADAAVGVAEAAVAQARAGARPGQIAVARSELAQVRAIRDAAARALDDAQALVQNPQEVDLQIAVSAQQLRAAQIEVEQALARKDAAEVGKDQFEDAQAKIMEAGGPGKHRVPVPGAPPGTYYEYTVPSLPLEMHLLPNQWWQAWVAVNAAAARKDGLQASLDHLYQLQANPQELQAQADQAAAALAMAETQVKAATAQLDLVEAGPSAEEIAALEAKVGQAQAAADALRSQLDQAQLTAPMDGVVVALDAHPGEVAAPGASLLVIADLARVKLTIYLPETQIGEVQLGQPAEVSVDSFERTFSGVVTYIADQAEFTPRNVTTQQERVNLVFAVEIALDNPDGALKPGMPADAVLH
jgi:multidrug resistance efflux pump